MRRWHESPRAYILLLAITFVVRIATALPLQQAGYMDAAYAIHVAENLASGRGLTEDVIWNYLDQPTGLPHPSNFYWMPLPSLLIAPFFVLFGVSYRVAQIPFILLSLIPPLFAFHLGRKVSGRDDYAWVGALLTVFSGFYMVYWVSPDNFTPFAVTASLCLYTIARGIETNGRRYLFAAGVLAGLCHLARADGILLLAVVPIALLVAPFGAPPSAVVGYDGRSTFMDPISRIRSRVSRLAPRILLFTLFAVLGYLVVMTPWFVRNYLAVGAPYPSAGTKTLWLTSYDELFRYADDLTPARYWAWGLYSILESKVVAIFRSLLVLSFADMLLFLTPFVLIGLVRLRKRIEFLPFFVYAFLLFWVMVLAFTFPSWRGTLLHSGIALLPFCSIAVPPGIEATVRWVARRRRTWDAARALPVFQSGFVALAVFLSFYIYGGGLFGSSVGREGPLWNERDAGYSNIARWIERNARDEAAVMAGDPLSFYSVSHQRTIVIPSDGVDAVLAAAQRYGASYLVLDYDYPRPLKDLYEGRTTVQGLTPLVSVRDPAGHPVILFEVTP